MIISGDPALDPDPLTTATFNVSGNPTLSNDGWIVFNAGANNSKTLSGHSCDIGLWTGNDIIDCGTINGGIVKDGGYLAFNRQFAPSFTGLPRGILSNRTGALTFVAVVGGATPDSLASFSNMGSLAQNASGETVFYASTAGGYIHGLFRDSAGSGLTVLAKPGTVVPVPGSGAGGVLLSVSNTATINAAGESLVFATSDLGTGIWVDAGRAVAVSGTVIPLAELPLDWIAGATFGNISTSATLKNQPDINGNGEVAFSVPIVGGPAGAFRVLFVERYDGVSDLYSLHEVARIGDAVNRFGRVDDANPLCTANDCLSFNSQPHTVVLNDAGDVAFVACQSLTNCGVVKARWNASTSDYDLDLVVKNGDTDTAGAALSGNALGRFMLNRFGQLAFFSISSPDGHGIWAWDESLGLVRVVAPGDVLTFPRADPGPDLQRTFRAISLAGENLNCVASGGADGRPSCFNDHGQIVFNAHFVEGGEAIVLATR